MCWCLTKGGNYLRKCNLLVDIVIFHEWNSLKHGVFSRVIVVTNAMQACSLLPYFLFIFHDSKHILHNEKGLELYLA